MIFFIFGDNIVESRNKLLEFSKGNYPEYEIVHLGDCPHEKDFREKINTSGFFSNKQLFIFENFFKGRAEKWKTEIDFNKLENNENIYVFWDEATLNMCGKKACATANKKNVFEFKLPNLLWAFLDNIKPNNPKILIDTLDQVLKAIEVNYLFLMLVRQFRLLILAKEKYADYPSDWKRLTFQKYKLAKQASFFSPQNLQMSYGKLLEIEARQKTGQAIYDLKTELEKFLLSI